MASASSKPVLKVLLCSPRGFCAGVVRAIESVEKALAIYDAPCPLVTKVHREAEIHNRRGREIVLIGHAGHPEVVGTMGQLPPGSITLVETLEDVAEFTPRDAN